MRSEKKKNTKPSKSKKKNKIKKILAIILFILLIILFVAAVGLGIYYIITADAFKVKTIKIENSTYYSEEQILEIASIDEGKNMLLLPRSKIKKNILKELPYIENIKIKTSKDSTLRLIVAEREARYVVNNKDTNEFLRIDKHGIMLEKVNSEDILDGEIPFFGLSLDENEKIGKNIPQTELKKIQRYESIKDAYQKAEIEAKITSVKFENDKIILTLDYKTEVVTEVFDNLEYKMKFLKEILDEVSGKSGRIDLTLDNPSFVEKLG